MVHVKFDPNSVTLSEFEHCQIGGGAGGEYGEYNYFHGSRPYMRGFGYYQHGAGVGDFLRTLWRAFKPSLKSIGKTIGNETLAFGGRALEKIAQGENPKEVLVKEAVKGVDNLLEKGGVGRQFGTGIKRRRNANNKQKSLSGMLVGKSVILPRDSKKPQKRKRSDAFGFY